MPDFDFSLELNNAFKEKLFSSINDEERKKEIALKCIEVITKQPECILGFLRFQSFKQKMLQLLTQSYEIKTGDMLEVFFTKLIGSEYTNLDKNITDPDDTNIKKKCDQLFEREDEIILIEHKIRDNHDSTKKSGQAANFEQKVQILHKKFPEKRIKSYEWFIDEQFTKNKNYYENGIEEFNLKSIDYNQSYLVYGRELIDEFFEQDTWDNFVEAYLTVKLSYITNISVSMDSYDFDNDPDEIVYNNLIKKRGSVIKLFFDEEFIEVRETLFPDKVMVEKIYDYHNSKKKKSLTGKEYIKCFEENREDI